MIQLFPKILILIFIFIACQPQKSFLSDRQIHLKKSCEYLWNQQKEDGGWHSDTHGILKGGESLTAFILWHLSQIDSKVYSHSEVQFEKGLDFLRKRISKEGISGLSDSDIVDYPNYSTAYALRLFAKYGSPEDADLIKKMKNYLLEQQFTEQRGFSPEHLAYGAWGFGETDLKFGEHGHVDLSHTRRILETLRLVGNVDESVFEKARFFLHLLQKHPNESRVQLNQNQAGSIPYDGGFYASAVTTSTNKSAPDTLNFFPSYATATADGLLARMASGYGKNDEPVQKAFQWLKNHPILIRPEGIPTDDVYEWHKVLFFYHLSVRSEALSQFDFDSNWREEMTEILIKKQHPDGSFMNPYGGLNKEDDPLLATTLAVIALSNCRKKTVN